MAILSFLRRKPKQKVIQTSRPIFQHSSSFLKDDDDLQKPAPAILPLFHHRNHHINQPTYSNEANHTYHAKSLLTPPPQPRQRIHLILHSLSIIFTVVSLTLFITVIPLWNSNFQHTASLIPTDYTDGLVLAPLLLSLFTSAYLLLTQHTSLASHIQPRFSTSPPKRTRTTPPKVLVLLSLTILITLGVALALSGMNSLAHTWRSAQPTKSGSVVCNLVNMFTPECQPILYQVGGLQIGGIATGGMAGCVWLAVCGLAVQGVVREKQELERRRRERRLNRDRSGRHRHRHRRHRGRGRDREQRSDDGSYSDASRPSEKEHPTQYSRQQHGVPNNDLGYEPTYGVGLGGQHRAGSAAVLMANSNIRPKETIQVWLNSRYI